MTLVRDEGTRFAIQQIERNDSTQKIGFVLGELEQRLTAIEADLYNLKDVLSRWNRWNSRD